MRVKYLIEAIKHSVTVKSVRDQLTEPLKRITDNEEEFQFLLDKIPQFYVAYYNKGIEHIEVYGNDGSVHMNDGTDRSVGHPVSMTNNEKYLLSIHNHPNKVSELQSNGDYGLQVEYNTKYGVSVGFHGLVITKNGFQFDPELSRSRGDEAYYCGDMAIMRRFHKLRKTNPECVKARDDWLDDKISMEEMDKRIESALTSELNSMDINEVISEQNGIFVEHDLPLKSEYLPIKKLYED